MPGSELITDAGRLADRLTDVYKGKRCVVNLRKGSDDLGQARMMLERVYVDDFVDKSKTLRVLGHETGNTEDHASFAIPITDSLSGELNGPNEPSEIVAQDFTLTIIPQ